ncbi:hypothetical protein AgCh_001369 [Apium graveolens]
MDCHGEKDLLCNNVGTSFGNTSYRYNDMYNVHDDDFEDCKDFDEEPNVTAKAKEFYEMKNRHNCSNNGFDDLPHLIGLVLPGDHKLPEKYYTIRKMIRGLNMEYEKIDACENDCNLACPVCMGEVKAKQLKHGGKSTFYGISRYFLEADDPLRRRTRFGSIETRSVCARHSGSFAKTMCDKIQFPPPGKSTERKPRDYGMTYNWTHSSPFFELSYWETLSLRHNIDIMHTEKNIFDNIFYIILDDGKKSKDNTKARNDWFFDPMEHLPLHLATEFGNKARAKGSMAQRYIEEESVHFCSLFFDSKVVNDQLRRNEAPRKFHDVELLEVYTYLTHPSLRSRDRILNSDEHELVAYYVLINSPEVGKYLRGFQKLVQQHYPLLNDAKKEQYQKEKFKDWFERRVQDDEKLKKKFLDLIRGLMFKVESYKACKCNDYKFSCAKDKELTSPNSGVVIIRTSYNESYGNYYGRVEEVLKLFYHNGHQVIVFKCHWFDHTTHVKVDRHRMTTVDVKSKLNADDVFLLASQAHQVYYAPNISNAKSSWYTVLTTKSRQVDESVSTKENLKINNDALQNEVSNTSSSHVERVTIHDPLNFFIDLRIFENDYSIDHDDEEESKKNKEAGDEDEENGVENDELTIK